MSHTAKQREHWRAYEHVRQAGRYNMLERNAQLLTGLTPQDYAYCMEHYSTLREAVEPPHATGGQP